MRTPFALFFVTFLTTSVLAWPAAARQPDRHRGSVGNRNDLQGRQARKLHHEPPP